MQPSSFEVEKAKQSKRINLVVIAVSLACLVAVGMASFYITCKGGKSFFLTCQPADDGMAMANPEPPEKSMGFNTEFSNECYISAGYEMGTPAKGTDQNIPTPEQYDAALKELDIEAVKADIVKVLTDNQRCWRADRFGDQPGNYGPFFVRLAWHCSGSYRETDGTGGCAGGRQRFEPEASWEDNTNLDKARALLWEVKKKYKDGLSWGDLFALAGTTALREMDTPITQFCFGRRDDSDGQKSVALGGNHLQEATTEGNQRTKPTKEQEAAKKQEAISCETPGDALGVHKVSNHCKEPLGSNTVGLIYLNPEGSVEQGKVENGEWKPNSEGEWKPNPDPKKSVKDIRDTFKRMDHSDRATVALIGGGHAIGKTHGACPKGAGSSPVEAYSLDPKSWQPWPGKCGSGSGVDTFTSGFEGPWTTNPLKWDNEFFKKLFDNKWEKHEGPGGHWQWRISKPANEAEKKLMRLTSDMALLEDEEYKKIAKEFADDMDAFNKEFDSAWTKLVTKSPVDSWSANPRCDSGTFPKDLLSKKSAMLSTDINV